MSSTTLIVWDSSFPGGFLLNCGRENSIINKIGESIYDKIKGDLLDTQTTTLNRIMGNIGKDYIREKRLSKILDGDPTNSGSDSFINRMKKRFTKKKK